MEHEYGLSDGIPLRRSTETGLLEIYRGDGNWELYSDFQDWWTNTQPLADDEVQDALDRFDARAAAE